MQLFIVGINGKLFAPRSSAYGYTSRSNKTCWVLGKKVDAFYNSKQRVIDTIGHEVGHILFGGGHPDEEEIVDQGVAPLSGTEHAKRLMYSANTALSRLIVKKEWDAAEVWLKGNVDTE